MPAGGAAMSKDRPAFSDLMVWARQVVVVLDDVMPRDGSRARAAAISVGSRFYSRLLDYQRTVRMTKAESDMLQNTIDLLRARLQFLGRSV